MDYKRFANILSVPFFNYRDLTQSLWSAIIDLKERLIDRFTQRISSWTELIAPRSWRHHRHSWLKLECTQSEQHSIFKFATLFIAISLRLQFRIGLGIICDSTLSAGKSSDSLGPTHSVKVRTSSGIHWEICHTDFKPKSAQSVDWRAGELLQKALSDPNWETFSKRGREEDVHFSI